jgi:hypothetical protein
MKATFLRSILAIILMVAAQSVHAQAVITEYFDVKETLKVDLGDKKTAKTMYSKGVLDIDWNSDKRVLAISYDPKVTKIEDIMLNLSTVIGAGFADSMNKKKRN